MAFSASAVRAGKAIVELLLDRTTFTKGLNDAGDDLKKFAATANKIGNALATVGAAGIASMGGALTLASTSGDALLKASERTRVAIETLSGLRYAAEQSGTSFDTLTGAIFRMQRRIANAATGSGPAVRALRDLGLSAEEITKLPVEEQFFTIVRALEGVENEALAAQYGFEILGDNVRALVPLLNQGEAGIRDLMDRAGQLGLIMSEEDARAAGEFGDALADLKEVAKATTVAIGAALAGPAKEFTLAAAESASAVIEWVKRNRELIITAAKVAAGLLTVGTTIKAVAAGATALSKVFYILAAHPWFVTIGIATAALAALAGAFDDSVGEAKRFAQAQEDVYKSGQRAREGHQKLLDRLEALSQKQRLSNSEQAEARRIVAELSKTYGDLGVTINSATGAIEGFGEAQARVQQQMRQAAQMELAAAIEARRFEEQQARQAARDLGEGGYIASYARYFGALIGVADNAETAAEKLNAHADTAAKQARALEARLQALKDGGAVVELAAPIDPDAPVDAPAPEALSPHMRAFLEAERAAEEERRRKVAQEDEEAFRRQQQINESNAQLFRTLERLQAELDHTDEAARRRALLELEQRHEREDAERAGLDLDLLARLHEAQLQRLERELDRAATESSAGGLGGFSGSTIARQYANDSLAMRQLRAIEAVAQVQREAGQKIVKAIEDAAPQVN